MRRFLLTIALALLVLGALYIADRDRERAAEFFSASLEAYNITESVVIDGEVFDIARGTVSSADHIISSTRAYRPLALAYEKAQARRNPLTALPNVDIATLRMQIEELQRTANNLASLQTSEREAQLVSKSLYPIDMLSELLNVEQMRRQFLELGTDESARAYGRAQLKFVDAYMRDIRQFRAAFEELVPYAIPTYATERKLVSRTDLLDALGTLANGVDAKRKEILNRISCVHGNLRACDIASLAVPALPETTELRVSYDAAELGHDVRDLLAAAGASFVPGPLYELNSSSCVRKAPGTALLFAFTFNTQPDGSLASSSSPTYVGDIHLIRSTQFADKPFYEFFAERGIAYVNSNPLTYYGCLQTDRDQSLLLAMRDIREFSAKAALSAYAASPENIALVTLENKRNFNNIVSLKDVVEYIRAAHELSTSGALPIDMMNTITEFQLSLAYGSSGIAAVIPDVVRREYTDMRIAREYGVSRDFAGKYLFFARSAVLPLFLSSNSSAVGVQRQLLRDNTLDVSLLPYTYYSDLHDSPKERERVLQDESYFRTLHNNI